MQTKLQRQRVGEKTWKRLHYFLYMSVQESDSRIFFFFFFSLTFFPVRITKRIEICVVWFHSSFECRSRQLSRMTSSISGPGQTRLSASNLVRAYIDSLPTHISYRDELKSFQYWKSLRTELLSTILFTVFCNGPLCPESTPTEKALSFGLTIATLIQCTGHVSGCHLTISITLALLVSGRVSLLRLFSYLIVHMIGSLLGTALLRALWAGVPCLGPTNRIIEDLQAGPSRLFGFEFLFIFLISLAYLANVDQRRSDLGFKSLSIGFAATVGHFFAVSFCLFLTFFLSKFFIPFFSKTFLPFITKIAFSNIFSFILILYS